MSWSWCRRFPRFDRVPERRAESVPHSVTSAWIICWTVWWPGRRRRCRAKPTPVVTAAEEEIHRLCVQDRANMDRNTATEVAFMRVVSGRYEKGMKRCRVRTGRRVELRRADLYGRRPFARGKPTRATSSACNHGTVRSAIPSPRVKTASSPFRTSRRSCSAAFACAIAEASSC